MPLHSVCTVAELAAKPGESRVVEVDGIQIGVYYFDGRYYAYQNLCDHQGGPACEGDIFPHTEYAVDGNTLRVTHVQSKTEYSIACPWHGVEYDIKTGLGRATEEMRLRSFEVVVESGTVKVLV